VAAAAAATSQMLPLALLLLHAPTPAACLYAALSNYCPPTGQHTADNAAIVAAHTRKLHNGHVSRVIGLCVRRRGGSCCAVCRAVCFRVWPHDIAPIMALLKHLLLHHCVLLLVSQKSYRQYIAAQALVGCDCMAWPLPAACCCCHCCCCRSGGAVLLHAAAPLISPELCKTLDRHSGNPTGHSPLNPKP
jgi:hypothetical protein